MTGRGRLRWLLRPTGSSPLVSGVVAAGIGTFVLAALGTFEAGYVLEVGGWIVVVLTYVAAFLGVMHLSSLLSLATQHLLRDLVLAKTMVFLGLAAALLGAGFVTSPRPVEEAPRTVSTGGLSVFASAPIPTMTMTVRRSTVGLGYDDRQVLVDLVFPVQVEDVRLALVGSGAAAFDVAAVVTGGEIRSKSSDEIGALDPDEPVQGVHVLDVAKAPGLLPEAESGHVAIARRGGAVSTLMTPWFDRDSAVATSISIGSRGATSASTQKVTVTMALRLRHPSVGGSTGGLGEVGCASNLRAVASAADGQFPGDLIDLPDAVAGASTAWFIPDSCTADVIIGQVHGHAVVLNGQRRSTTDTTMVRFRGSSEGSSEPVIGIDDLTVAATDYSVPDLRPATGHPVLSGVLLSLGASAIGAAGSLLLGHWRRGRGLLRAQRGP